EKPRRPEIDGGIGRSISPCQQADDWRKGAIAARMKHRHHGNDTDKYAGEKNGDFSNWFPVETIRRAKAGFRQQERGDAHNNHGELTNQVLKLYSGSIHFEGGAWTPVSARDNGGNCGADQCQIEKTGDSQLSGG